MNKGFTDGQVYEWEAEFILQAFEEPTQTMAL